MVDALVASASEVISMLQLEVNRSVCNAEDYTIMTVQRCKAISGFCFIMEDRVRTNMEILEKERAMSAEFPTSIEQQAMSLTVAQQLKEEVDAAQLLNLESIAVSYEDIGDIIKLLLGLCQRIQDQDREINQLRERVNGPTGNQRQEPEIFHKSKNPWVL